ncbi:MAG: hypothetical protein GF331_16460, partial [Chitinivibrionales bacterium]|nr:hypothetical protein [Chitinivibrionales bacterium]
QYMLGDSLLVAPVIGEGKRTRTVYFPPGSWYAFDKPAERMEGPGFAKVKAPLDRMPLFVREGSIIPRYIHHPQHLKSGLPERVGVDLYPGGRRSSVCYTDDDIRFSMSAGTHKGVVRFAMGRAPVTVVVRAMGMPDVRVSCPRQAAETRSTSSATIATADAEEGLSLAFGE